MSTAGKYEVTIRVPEDSVALLRDIAEGARNGLDTKLSPDFLDALAREINGLRQEARHARDLFAARVYENEALRKDAKRDWANHACEHLPEGWSIEVELEKNSGVMLLRDPDGCRVEICTDDITIEQQIFDAVDAAIAAEVPRADA